MQVSLSDCLNRAWDHMKTVLFRPFDLRKWMVIGFSAWLAMLVGWNSGSGGGTSVDLERTDGETTFDREGFLQAVTNSWQWLVERPLAMVLITVAVLAFFLLIIALLWVSSRGKFIFLDNVVRNRAEIVEPWRRFQTLGDSLFLFRLGLGAVFFLFGSGLIGGALWYLFSLDSDRVHVWAAGVLLWIAFFTLFWFAIVLISFLLDAFVVPIMHRRNLTVVAAWDHLLPLLTAHLGSFILCGLLLFVLALGVGVLLVLAGVLTCCVGWLILAIPYIGTVLTLPIWVTYRAFTVEFLRGIDPTFEPSAKLV